MLVSEGDIAVDDRFGPESGRIYLTDIPVHLGDIGVADFAERRRRGNPEPPLLIRE